MNRVVGLREWVDRAFVFCLRMDIHGVNLLLKAVFESFGFRPPRTGNFERW